MQNLNLTKKKFLTIIVSLFVLAAIPLTVQLAQQPILPKQAATTSAQLSSVIMNVPEIHVLPTSKSVALSAIALDAGGNPIYSGVTYEWGISSNDVGTLSPTNDTITNFTPKNLGQGDLFVTARQGLLSVQKSIKVTVSNNPPVSKEGLVAWYSFDEGKGSTFSDSSDMHQNSGNLYSTKWISGVKNGALRLVNGTYAKALLENPKKQISLSLWIKPENMPNDGGASTRVIVSSTGSGNTYYPAGYEIVYNEVQQQLEFVLDSQVARDRVTTSYIPDNRWHHVAGVYDGSSIKLYLDGVFKSSTPHSGDIRYTDWVPNMIYMSDPPTMTTTTGAFFHRRIYNGSIDEVKLFNRPLAEEEIKGEFSSNRPYGYYNMDDGNGTSVRNIMGQIGALSNGTLSGATWTTGVSEKALFFDGVDDRISVPNSSVFANNRNQISVSSWVKSQAMTNDGGEQFRVIASKTAVYNERQTAFYLIFNELTQSLEFAVGNGTNRGRVVSQQATDDRWHHVVGTYDGSTVRLYVDGQLKNSTQFSGKILSNTSPLYIGKDAGARPFKGVIDEVRLYSQAMNDSEVSALYTNGSTLLTP